MVVILFIIGACLGSFYLVVGKRLPKNEDIILSRSKCDSCNHTLFWYDLIPIFSYIFLLGKCRYCHKKISITKTALYFLKKFFIIKYHLKIICLLQSFY